MTARTFSLKDVHVYRPYADEVPWALLALSEADEASLRADTDMDLIRVAKLDGEAVGVYAIRALAPTVYELLALTVAPGCRRQGLGRWLLGHAIGIAESKGGREIRVRRAPGTALFERIGFAADAGGLRLLLTPE